MSNYQTKLISCANYHIWTDGLHARELARQTENRWNIGSYSRWAIISSWTAFELACEDALNTSKLGNRFRNGVDTATGHQGLPRLDWSQGLWQKVLQAYEDRKKFVHPLIKLSDVFTPVEEADRFIELMRAAIISIYHHVNKGYPKWVDDNTDLGWDGLHKTFAHGMVVYRGAREDDPDVIQIAFLYQGREYPSAFLPPGTDPKPFIEVQLKSCRMAFSHYRIYRGTQLIEEKEILIRGL